MKKCKVVILTVILLLLTSCGVIVPPNQAGVLMTNYGKSGQSDFQIVSGKVYSTYIPGTELYMCPLWEQRAVFENVLHLKAADNTEFTAKPMYAYKVIKERAVDVIFDNKHIETENFMKSLEDNILETKIYDIIKEESRKYKTDDLMANGGSLKFETEVQNIVKEEFNKKGFDLINLTCQLDFSAKVKAKIDSRNEVNTNISVLEQKIQEQKKRNELAELEAMENIIRSKGLTDAILKEKYIEMLGTIKQPIYGNTPINIFKSSK